MIKFFMKINNWSLYEKINAKKSKNSVPKTEFNKNSNSVAKKSGIEGTAETEVMKEPKLQNYLDP